MIIDQLFHIMHDLGITSMSRSSHFRQNVAALFVRCRRLGMEYEGYSQESLMSNLVELSIIQLSC